MATRSPDGADGSRECAPDDRLREIRGRNVEFPDYAALHPGYADSPLNHVAHDNRVDIAGREFRALKRRADSHGTEIDRRHILQRAAVCADGGARANR